MILPLKADKSIDVKLNGFTNNYYVDIKIMCISYFKECKTNCINCSTADKNLCYSCITGYFL